MYEKRPHLVALGFLLIFTVVGCAQPEPLQERRVEVSRATPRVVELPPPTAPSTRARVGEKERYAGAVFEVRGMARKMVRDNKLVDSKSCGIVPALLTASEHYPEFGPKMREQYRIDCLAEVREYQAEEKARTAKQRRSKQEKK